MTNTVSHVLSQCKGCEPVAVDIIHTQDSGDRHLALVMDIS